MCCISYFNPYPSNSTDFASAFSRFNRRVQDYTPVVIDLIGGEPLEAAWLTLSWWSRLRVIWYIRGYVRQMRSIPIPYPDKPGRFDDLDRPYLSPGLFFTQGGAHPCESYNEPEMADRQDCRRFDALVLWHQRTGNFLSCPKFDHNQPFVFCHGDINMSNIIVDRKGIPWIIDFGEAGVYPIWPKYTKAALQFGPYVPAAKRPSWLWIWATRFMFGNYGKYFYNYLHVMARVGIWDNHPIDFSRDYFTELGIDVD